MTANKLECSSFLPEGCYVHLSEDCSFRSDGEICVVYHGEHKAISVGDARVWRDALSEAITTVERRDNDEG